jgi:hypothetical protein
MKLQINKFFIKEPITKIKNQKNKNLIWNSKKREDQPVIFRVGERKKRKKRFTVDKPRHLCWHAPHHQKRT